MFLTLCPHTSGPQAGLRKDKFPELEDQIKQMLVGCSREEFEQASPRVREHMSNEQQQDVRHGLEILLRLAERRFGHVSASTAQAETMAEHGEGMFAIPILQLTLRKMDMGTGSNGGKQVRNARHGHAPAPAPAAGLS